jgi:iron complex transport system permease protein
VLHAVPGLRDALGWWSVPVAAFLGAQTATVLVMSLARGPGGRLTMLGLILGGVIINSFCAALITLLLTRFEPLRLRITTLWLAGGVGFNEWCQLAVAAVAVLAGLVFIRLRANHLNAFALGEEGAGLVGVDSRRLLMRSAWAASLLTGVAVSLAGLVGYVGLIVPHLVRSRWGC